MEESTRVRVWKNHYVIEYIEENSDQEQLARMACWPIPESSQGLDFDQLTERMNALIEKEEALIRNPPRLPHPILRKIVGHRQFLMKALSCLCPKRIMRRYSVEGDYCAIYFEETNGRFHRYVKREYWLIPESLRGLSPYSLLKNMEARIKQAQSHGEQE